MKSETTKKIGLALGGGAARGGAHLGVIRALAEAGIRVDCVAGTSIGSLVGAVYAAGHLPEFEAVVRDAHWKQTVSFLDVVFPSSGFIGGNKVSDFIRDYVQADDFDELSMPFAAVSTDLGDGEEVVIRGGNLIEAIRASISVPGIFRPVVRDDKVLVDGGLVNPVPVSAAREMGADFVIAVDLGYDVVKRRIPQTGRIEEAPQSAEMQTHGKMWKITRPFTEKLSSMEAEGKARIHKWMNRDPSPNLIEVLLTSLNVMEAQIAASRLEVDPPDILIQPRVGHIQFLEFHRAKEAIDIGYEDAMAAFSRAGVLGDK